MKTPTAKALDSAWERSRAAHPSFTLSRQTFFEVLGAQAAELSTLNVADLYLAHASAAGDEAALRTFESLLQPLVVDTVGRALNKQPAFVEDVLQALRTRLLVADEKGRVRLREYRGEGSLAGWLRSAAMRTALNLQKATKEHAPLDAALAGGLEARADDPEVEALKRRCRKELKGAIHAALAKLEPEQRELLRLNLLESQSIDRLAERLKVSRATAARRLVSVRARIFALVREELRARLEWSTRELESVVGLVRSQLDLNLSQHLR